jgi:hypothetical protein
MKRKLLLQPELQGSTSLSAPADDGEARTKASVQGRLHEPATHGTCVAHAGQPLAHLLTTLNIAYANLIITHSPCCFRASYSNRHWCSFNVHPLSDMDLFDETVDLL